MGISLDKLLALDGNKYVFCRAAMTTIDKIANIEDSGKDEDEKLVSKVLNYLLDEDVKYTFDDDLNFSTGDVTVEITESSEAIGKNESLETLETVLTFDTSETMESVHESTAESAEEFAEEEGSDTSESTEL